MLGTTALGLNGVSLNNISLAVIAAACAIGVLMGVPTLIQVKRTAARAEAVLAQVELALPPLLAQLRELAAKTDQAVESLAAKADRTMDTLGGLTGAIERVGRLTTVATSTLEQAGGAVRTVTKNVVLPSMVNAAGVLAALLEGIQWIWPRPERGRRDHP